MAYDSIEALRVALRERELRHLSVHVREHDVRIETEDGDTFAVFGTHEGRTLARATADAEIMVTLWMSARSLVDALARELHESVEQTKRGTN